mgnify:CR=1 FL=1
MISMSWRRDQVWPFFSTVTLGGRWRRPSTGPAGRLGLSGWWAGRLSELADEKGWFLCRAARFFPAHAKKTDKIESSEKSHHDNWMGSRPDQDGMYTVQSGRWKWVGWVGIFSFDILGEKTATDTYVIIAHPNSNTSFHRPWNHFPKQNL